MEGREALVLIVEAEKARMVLSLEKAWLTELLARDGTAAGRATLRHRAIEAIFDEFDC